MYKDVEMVNKGTLKKEYEVTVLICSYKPDYKKLLTTIDSCILQQNIDIQIVISDDGTNDFNSNIIVDFFEKKRFDDYVITHLSNNMGSVKNAINGLRYCRGEYTKIISPGDYLYTKTVLEDWLELIKRENAVVSFANCIHYHYVNNKLVPIAVLPNPYENKQFYKGMWEYNYLIFDDIVTGAAMLSKTSKLKEYFKIIDDKVKYADDNVFRIMAFNHEKAAYYDKDAVLYEHGFGISTCGSESWRQIILDDWNHTDEIMLESINEEDILHRRFMQLKKCKNQKNSFYRKMQLLSVKGKLMFIIKKSVVKRYTNINIDADYVEELIDL